MNASTSSPGRIATKTLISTLWIVVVLNMLAGDVLSLFIPGATEELNAVAGAMPIPMLMLVAAVVFEIPIVMILLARILKRGPSRWVNIAAAIINGAFVVGGGASFPHYKFIMAVEVLSMLAIVWKAWTWPAAEE